MLTQTSASVRLGCSQGDPLCYCVSLCISTIANSCPNLNLCFLFFFSRIGENLEQALPSLTELILTNNNIAELVSCEAA